MRHGLWTGVMCLAVLLPGYALASPDTPPAQITTQFNPSQGFPDHNGPFSALLVVIPQSELAEFEKSAGGDRQLQKVARAQPGSKLSIKLLFSGLAVDASGQANVTYDLQVIAPGGGIYGHSDYKGLVAWQGPGGDGVFDNRQQVASLNFEPQDATGVYQVRAVLHDAVGHRDIPLTTSVELIAASLALPPVVTLQPIANASSASKPVKKHKPHRRKHRH